MAIDMQTFLREYDEDIIFLGDAVDIYRERILDILKDRAHFAPKNRNMPSGVSVAELGLKKKKTGRPQILQALRRFISEGLRQR